MEKKNNIIMIVILLLVVVLSFGYVSYSTMSNQPNTSKKVVKWEVGITNVEVITNGNAEDNNYTYNEGTIVLKPTLYGVEDSILYRITIKNSGTIAAKLGRNIYNDKKDDSKIIFTYINPQEELAPGEETTLIINASIDEDKYEVGRVYNTEYTAIYEYIQK